MFKNSSRKVLFIIGSFIIAISILPILDKYREADDEKRPSFYDVDINADVNENLEVGYLFEVSNKTYKLGTYHYVIQAKQNDERINFFTE